jgi:hypothetical protein
MEPKDALGKLVAAIEKVAPATWETMVAYQRIEAITDGLICLVIGLLALAGLRRSLRGYTEESHHTYKEPWIFAMVASSMVAMACLVICVPLSVQQFFTPEYHAIEELLEVAK